MRRCTIFLEGLFAILSNILLFTSRVDSNNAFPHPLSPEKEKEYFASYKRGDISSRDMLIKHNLRLVAHIAKKYTNYQDQEELISIGSLGLIKGIETFSEGKGTQLATYVSRCIENEILMAMRTQKRHAKSVSIYESIGVDKEGNELTLMDLLAVDEETTFKKVENDMLKRSLIDTMKKCLTKREIQILALRYGLTNGIFFTQKEVASKLKISRSYVSRIEKRALESLKESIDKDNILF